ncbi:882_t:CDS:2 [Funneliformis mosseae]|uniref:882_t:CDS:1 n=1 Tax=Funneliformis mosseae TaxID=27381 RepID=A0A9N9EYK4_FUNMO|nr:882_t:CDS:2 [Funneliformis mosseae]
MTRCDDLGALSIVCSQFDFVSCGTHGVIECHVPQPDHSQILTTFNRRGRRFPAEAIYPLPVASYSPWSHEANEVKKF